jgi:hypothetical protein
MFATDGKLNQRALRLSAPEALSRDFDLAHGVEFDPPPAVVQDRTRLVGSILDLRILHLRHMELLSSSGSVALIEQLHDSSHVETTKVFVNGFLEHITYNAHSRSGRISSRCLHGDPKSFSRSLTGNCASKLPVSIDSVSRVR